jgi:hypothetical protein
MQLARLLSVLLATVRLCSPVGAAVRQEHFEREPPTWEGYNNHSTNFPRQTVTQDFGWSPGGRHFGEPGGEIGGKINPAGDAAYYAYRLPRPLSLGDALSASGKMIVLPGPGHFLLGFFNPATLNEWRTPNTLVMRPNGRGENFHCHLEFCSSRWRSDAGVIGEIVPGKSIAAKAIPSGQVYGWELVYDPKGGDEGSGLATLKFANQTATCPIAKEHRADGAMFTHFGLLPVLKAWDNPGEVWVRALTVNGKKFDFARDPGWDEFNNRRSYETKNTRPRFDFGWSPTHHAGGNAAGELGGLIFRGDCRYPQRMAAYGDRLALLTLNAKLYARGKVAMTRGVTDSTASIGFYHSKFSLQQNPAQDQSVPMDFVGINIEGPSSEGFFFYPVYRVHGDVAGANSCRKDRPLRIYPDGKSHEWLLLYDPGGANGRGQITVTLDGRSCTLELAAGAKGTGASFDRFGICTPWIDGNSVTAYFDDLEYTCSP